MTSKAERARKKRAGRKIAEAKLRDRLDVPSSPPRTQSIPEGTPVEPRVWKPSKRDIAFDWFAKLRAAANSQGPDRATAREWLARVKAELGADEYNVLCEVADGRARPAYRIGQSQHRMLELYHSALRKLVVYLHMHNFEGEL